MHGEGFFGGLLVFLLINFSLFQTREKERKEKEREICEFEMDLNSFFVCALIYVMIAQLLPKSSVWKRDWNITFFLSEIGSGFEELGSTPPPPRIPGSTPPPPPRVPLLQILLIFCSRCNCFFFLDIQLRIYRLFNFYMLFHLMQTKFFTSNFFWVFTKSWSPDQLICKRTIRE